MPLNTWKNFHRFSSLRGKERSGSCVKRVKCNILFSLFFSFSLSLFFFLDFILRLEGDDVIEVWKEGRIWMDDN